MERAGDRSRSAIPGLGYVTEPKRIERKGLTIHVDGMPKIMLAFPIMTRPQDWNPTARAILWPELCHSCHGACCVATPTDHGELAKVTLILVMVVWCGVLRMLDNWAHPVRWQPPLKIHNMEPPSVSELR